MGINFCELLSKKEVKEAAGYIRENLKISPEIAIVLGSGLSVIEDRVRNKVVIDYSSIPHYPQTTVSGHPGRIVAGLLNGIPTMALLGRFHYYEGKSLEEVVFPVLTVSELGVKKLIITNAAGAVNPEYMVGDLVLLDKYINFAQLDIFDDGWEKRESAFFSTIYYDRVQALQDDYPGKIHRGTYCWMTGPGYETPAEIRFVRHLGGDVVGMSTIPEVVVAKRLGLAVIGISFVTNPGAGISGKPLSHEEVKRAAESYKDPFCSLVERCVRVIS